MIGMTVPLAGGTAAESAAAEISSNTEAHQVPDMHLQTRIDLACKVLTELLLVYVSNAWLRTGAVLQALECHLLLQHLNAPCSTFILCAADRDSNDFEDHLLPSQRNYTGVLKMRGLPFAATPEDIVYWFNSAGLPIQAITSERCPHCTRAWVYSTIQCLYCLAVTLLHQCSCSALSLASKQTIDAQICFVLSDL